MNLAAVSLEQSLWEELVMLAKNFGAKWGLSLKGVLGPAGTLWCLSLKGVLGSAGTLWRLSLCSIVLRHLLHVACLTVD